MERCPVAEGYDLLDPAMVVDPYPVLSRWREETPVFYVPGLDHYIVTRFSDVEAILLDRDTWSAANASSPLMPVCAGSPGGPELRLRAGAHAQQLRPAAPRPDAQVGAGRDDAAAAPGARATLREYAAGLINGFRDDLRR